MLTYEMFVLCLCFIFVSIHNAKCCTKDELIMVQFLTRHGSSAPFELYPTDPNPVSAWREGLGEVTMLGKFQSYALGSLLRKQYNYFIETNPTEVSVLSCGLPTCFKSALSLASALYAPNKQWEIVRDLPWQPIFVEYNSPSVDKYLAIPECPAADQEYERILASEEAQEFLIKYTELFDYWSLHSGWQINNWDTASLLFDVLNVEQNYNLTIPMWARRYWEELQYIADMSLFWNLKTKLVQRLRGGPLLELVMDLLKKKSSGSLMEKKVIVYTTLGENVAAFLSTLNFFNNREVPFSATVAIELYEERKENFVRFLYFNSTMPEREPQHVHILHLDGCSEFCPLDYIVDYTKDLIPDDWESECQLPLKEL